MYTEDFAFDQRKSLPNSFVPNQRVHRPLQVMTPINHSSKAPGMPRPLHVENASGLTNGRQTMQATTRSNLNQAAQRVFEPPKTMEIKPLKQIDSDEHSGMVQILVHQNTISDEHQQDDDREHDLGQLEALGGRQSFEEARRRAPPYLSKEVEELAYR